MSKDWIDRTVEEDGKDDTIELGEKSLYIVVYGGKDRGKRFRIRKGEMVIGRWPQADILIHDERISRIHCRVISEGENIFVEDNNSRNGTFVDGEKIDKVKGQPGTVIQIGRTLMKIEYKSISEVEYDEDLYESATLDGLTGIMNRRNFMNRAEDEIALAARNNKALGIIMFDIDHFKNVNDTYGHQAGDYVLEVIARLVEDQARAEDLFGRYGGEEFIIMPRGDVTLEGTSVFCERLRRKVEEYAFSYHETDIPVTVSLGYSVRPASELKELNVLIKEADDALYRAKEGGRNKVECANDYKTME